MAYRMIVLDLDGTLTNSQKVISPRTYEALMAAQERGIRVVLASGRPTQGVVPLAKELELDRYGGYILSFNGAKVIDFRHQEVIFEKSLPESRIHEVIDLAKRYKVNLLTYENESIITETPGDVYVQKEAAINKMAVKYVVHLLEYIYFPPVKFLMLADGERLAAVEPLVREELGEEFNVYRSEPYFLEIMPRNIDKAYSLEKLLRHLRMTREEMVCCGDGYNDVSMIRFAGLGVAMANANEAVKREADYITAGNDEDGIAHVIEKFF